MWNGSERAVFSWLRIYAEHPQQPVCFAFWYFRALNLQQAIFSHIWHPNWNSLQATFSYVLLQIFGEPSFSGAFLRDIVFSHLAPAICCVFYKRCLRIWNACFSRSRISEPWISSRLFFLIFSIRAGILLQATFSHVLLQICREPGFSCAFLRDTVFSRLAPATC